MKQISRHKNLKRIGVTRDGFILLEKMSRHQRGCKPLNDDQLERMWQKRAKTPEGFAILDDESMGGGDGTYYGKWTSWSCDDLKSILSDAGMTWIDLEPIEFDCIDVCI